MKVKLQNDAGLIREVPTGFSWTGFFFTGFVLLFRGMFARGLVYLCLVYGYQVIVLIFVIIQAAAQGQEAAKAVSYFCMILLVIPNFVFLFKVNKWTARYWLERGYKPVGPGWDSWGPKIGLAVPQGSLGSPSAMK